LFHSVVVEADAVIFAHGWDSVIDNGVVDDRRFSVVLITFHGSLVLVYSTINHSILPISQTFPFFASPPNFAFLFIVCDYLLPLFYYAPLEISLTSSYLREFAIFASFLVRRSVFFSIDPLSHDFLFLSSTRKPIYLFRLTTLRVC
jgi:hypothetical protein